MESVSEKDQTKDKSVNEIEELNDRIKTLTEQLDHAKREEKDLQTKNADLLKQIVSVKEQLGKQGEENEEQLSRVNTELLELKNAKSRAESANESLQLQVDQLQRDVKSFRKKTSDTRDNLGKKDGTIRTLEQTIHQLKSEKEDGIQEITKLSQELSNIKEEHDSLKRAETSVKSDNTSLSSEVQRLKQKMCTLENEEIERMKKEAQSRADMKDKELEVAELKGQVSRLTEEISKLKRQADDMKGQKSTSSSTLTELNREIEVLQTERDTKNSEIKLLRDEIPRLQTQLTNLTQRNNEVNLSYGDARRTAEQSKLRVAELERQLQKYESAKMSENMNTQKLEDQNQQLKEDNAKLSTSLDFTKAELSKLRETYASLKAASETKEKTLRDSHQQELERMSHEHSAALSRLDSRHREESEELQKQMEAFFASLQDDKVVEQDSVREAVRRMAETNSRTNQMMQAAFRAYQAGRERQYRP